MEINKLREALRGLTYEEQQMVRKVAAAFRAWLLGLDPLNPANPYAEKDLGYFTHVFNRHICRSDSLLTNMAREAHGMRVSSFNIASRSMYPTSDDARKAFVKFLIMELYEQAYDFARWYVTEREKPGAGYGFYTEMPEGFKGRGISFFGYSGMGKHFYKCRIAAIVVDFDEGNQHIESLNAYPVNDSTRPFYHNIYLPEDLDPANEYVH